MKTLLSVVVVLAMASPLYAETVLLQEDFQGGLPDASVNTLSGWTGNSAVTISSSTIDVGQSAAWGGGSGPAIVSKPFSPSLGVGDTNTLTATLYATTDGGYAQVSLYNQGNPYGTSALALRVWLDNTGITTEQWDGAVSNPSLHVSRSAVSADMDVKAVLNAATTDIYYRVNGTSDWTSAGSMAFDNLAAAYNGVYIAGKGGYAGGVDSIVLTSSAVPEPSSMALLATGVLGLIAYAWRKRR